MADFVIITDSSCDLTQQMVDALEIGVIPLTVSVDGKEYKNYPDGREIAVKDFYDLMRAGKTATTSAISVGTYIDTLSPILDEGKDVLVVSFSSGLSNTYNAGVLATDELREKYPDRKIYICDSLSASLGQGMLIYNAALLRKQGKDIDEVRDFVEQNKLKLCHWFTVDDLNHLKRGGRISGTTALAGTILGIKPILHVDNAGKLVSVSKTRGRGNALQKLADKIGESAIEPKEQVMFISHGDCEEEAKKLADTIKKTYKVKEVIINHVGPVIGAHSGVGTMAIFFFGNER